MSFLKLSFPSSVCYTEISVLSKVDLLIVISLFHGLDCKAAFTFCYA